ncbi:MAG: type II toxin-antitoxin system HicA family toxin [Synergistaceae bacterium]|nr:type II toxin-antitoxin system HicA family toxin [Synergistaceae bacterium]
MKTVGSHHHFKHPTKPGKVTVKPPQKDIPPKTLDSIMKQAGLK